MTTRVTRRIAAPRDRVYRALLDADAVAQWRFPAGMTCEVLEFHGVEGGSLRISLTYAAADRVGKTSGRTDTYVGRFTRLVANELVVEVDAFESDDPTLTGEMTSTIRLTDGPGGSTDLLATHEGLPASVSPEDNETGWREALDRLAALVEDPADRVRQPEGGSGAV
ncbi:MAG TPA: SRPBCC domain-containing protein [Mycobacteriales bacterium]|nr:SRPBCC domain-containing protein [Mycobacteriales bacterium]